MQKEINLLTGKLDRIFAVTDELIFRVRPLTYLNDIVFNIEGVCAVFCCTNIMFIDLIFTLLTPSFIKKVNPLFI